MQYLEEQVTVIAFPIHKFLELHLSVADSASTMVGKGTELLDDPLFLDEFQINCLGGVHIHEHILHQKDEEDPHRSMKNLHQISVNVVVS